MKKIDKISTFIGQDTNFEGKPKFHGTVRIDGRFKGEISGEGTLIVGEEAKIESDIYVSHILNSGEIRGNLTVEERIQINASGMILRNIEVPIMVISEGAIMEGNCKMQQTKEQDDRTLTVVSQEELADSPSS
jgi:cytoskeletal protein CcmA (bactofilin family)